MSAAAFHRLAAGAGKRDSLNLLHQHPWSYYDSPEFTFFCFPPNGVFIHGPVQGAFRGRNAAQVLPR